MGFVQVWVPGLVREDYRWSALEETSNFNRYQQNHMGSSATGARLPNGLDYFWDGQGVGSCWEKQQSVTTEPIAIPDCPAGGQNRVLADPNKLLLLVDCSGYDLSSRTLPAGCDWFATPGRPGVLAASITTQSALPVVQLIALLLVFGRLLRNRRRPGVLAWVPVAAGGIGSTLLLVASVEEFWYLSAPGVALLGAGWLGIARLMPSRRLVILTLALGVVALLEAVDSGLHLLPLPIGPVWVRLLVETAWIAWTMIVLFRPAVTSGARVPLGPAALEPTR